MKEDIVGGVKEASSDGVELWESQVSDMQKMSKLLLTIMSETAGDLFLIERRLADPSEQNGRGPGLREISPERRRVKTSLLSREGLLENESGGG